MIFSLAYCGKIWHLAYRKQIVLLIMFVAVVISMAVLDNSVSDWLNAADALTAVGLSSVVFVLVIRHKLDTNLALGLVVMLLIGYSFLRSLIFADYLRMVSQQSTPLLESYLKNLGNLKLSKDMISRLQNIMLLYQPAIWGGMQLTAAFLGILIYNRISMLVLPIRLIRFPFPVIYILMAGIAMYLMPSMKVTGASLAICSGIVYAIQGAGVISHRYGDFFAKARLLRTLLILTIILNYPVLILIALLGVLDVWFDFRKLNIKEDNK